MNNLPLVAALIIVAGCAGSSVEKSEPQYAEASPKVQVEDIGKLKADYEKSKAAYSAEKNDGTRKPYVDATVKYATVVMAGGGKPTEKYPLALRLYDEALKVDPANGEAKANRQLIVDIYKSLGKEPPQ